MPLRTLTVTIGSVAEVPLQERVGIHEAGMCEADIADLKHTRMESGSTVVGGCEREELKSSQVCLAQGLYISLCEWNLSLTMSLVIHRPRPHPLLLWQRKAPRQL